MQSPVYLAASNNGVKVNSFDERKISHLMPAELDEIVVNVSSSGNGFFYQNMVSSLASLGESVYTSSAVAADPSRFYNIFSQVQHLYQVYDIPPAMFLFTDPSEKEVDELKALGLTEFPGRRNAFVGTPNALAVPKIFKMSPISARGQTGYVSADGYLAYVYAIKGSQIFSSTSRAAAITSQGNVFLPGGNNYCQPASDKATIGLYSMGGSVKRDGMVNAPGFPHVYNYHDAPVCVFDGISGESTLKGWFGSVTSFVEVPNTEKLFFGYFDGMVLPDKTTFCHVFPKLFFHSITGDIDRSQKLWSRLRAGYRSMAYTSAGKIISHLYYGIGLAIQASAAFTPIVEGNRYVGFVLEAKDIVAYMHGQKFEGGNRADLIKALETLNQHEVALAKIVKLINSAAREDGSAIYNYTAEDVNTSRKLRNILFQIDFSVYQGQIVKELGVEVDLLNFTEAFQAPTAKTIDLFLDFVQTGNVNLLVDQPAYLRAGAYAKQGRVAMGLSIFGGRVPSISYGREKEASRHFSILSNGEDPNLKKDANGKRALPYLPFSLVPYNVGLSQWEMMFKAGTMLIPQPRKGKQETFTNNTLVNLKITDDAHFKSIYEKIKQVAKEEQKAKATGKRSREDDAERAGIKKGKKKAEDVADDL